MRKLYILKLLSVSLWIFIASFCQLYSQDGGGNNNYINLYEEGKYKQSLDIITKKLEELYSNRVEDKRVPTGFITMKDIEKDIDLRELFRNRKAKGFFIEDNKELSLLHFYSARCHYELKKYDIALNHYYQTLRFKKIEFEKDDIVLYEIAQSYKKLSHFNAYLNALETACTLNQKKFKYSLELGKALYRTTQRKRAIYHLERYIKQSDEDIDPGIYLMIGNLYEDTAKYLETEKYYKLYLEKKPGDGYINFALGYIACKKTGNYPLATSLFNKSLKLLPETEIFRRSKAHEYIADMARNELEFEEAVRNYSETIKYQDKVALKIKKDKDDIKKLQERINGLKTSLLQNQDYDEFEEYEFNLEEIGKKEQKLKVRTHEYRKLNAGKVRWNMADTYERMGNLDEAIKYYRESISFNYYPNRSRKKITKLKLKIKRGY